MEHAYIESDSDDEGAGVGMPQDYEEEDEVSVQTHPMTLKGPVLARSTLLGKASEQEEQPITTTTTTTTTTTPQPTAPTAQPEKRKRGRPRKNSTGSTGAKAVSFASEAEVHEQPSQQPLQDPTPQPMYVPSRQEIQEWENQKTVQRLSERVIKEYERNAREKLKEKAKGGVDWDTAQALQEEEKKEKETLLRKIEMYYQYYPEECLETCTRKTKWSFKAPVGEMEEEINRCKRQLNIKRAKMGVEKAHIFLLYGLENLAISGFGIPAHNLAYEASKSKELFEEELAEIAIEHVDWFSMGAKTRYMFNVFLLFNKVVQANRKQMNAVSQNPQQTNVGAGISPLTEDELRARYGDL